LFAFQDKRGYFLHYPSSMVLLFSGLHVASSPAYQVLLTTLHELSSGLEQPCPTIIIHMKYLFIPIREYRIFTSQCHHNSSSASRRLITSRTFKRYCHWGTRVYLSSQMQSKYTPRPSPNLILLTFYKYLDKCKFRWYHVFMSNSYLQ
jgi:hypothetical protein